MTSRPSRLERITNLVLALLETSRPLSLREIGTLVEGYPSEPGALRQAFERDKRTLRDGGIPVTVDRIDGEDQSGYRIPPELYYLPDLGLDAHEQEALGFALAGVRLEGASNRDIAAKLGAGRVPDLPPIVVLPSLPWLGILQDGLRTRSTVSFSYRQRFRTIEGYGLVFRTGSWYLVGRDATTSDGNALRTFRVDRIETEPELGQPAAYELPAGFNARDELRFVPWTGPPLGDAAAEPATIEVLLAVDIREALAAIELVGASAIVERREDGSVLLRFIVADEDAFSSWVLGLGDAVEVIEPAELRGRVIAELRAACA